MTLAQNLKRIRKSRGMSQAALAEKAGVMQQLVSQIENGRNTSTKKLPAFAKALDCTVEDLDPEYSDGQERDELMTKFRKLTDTDDEAQLRLLEDYLDFLLARNVSPDRNTG